MLTLPGYDITAELYVGNQTVIYRGVRHQTRQPVILKSLKSEYPTAADIARIHHERAILETLDLPGVVKLLGLETDNNRPVLILSDSGGISLREYLAGKPLSVARFLSVASQLTQTLGQLHQRHIIHKDLKPSNIIVNPEGDWVQIADFALASRFEQEHASVSHPHLLEGTLAYMSPEQTGRMNRAIDYRSDFYSLGITFYEMLTGSLPFVSTDPMELVHAHIAKQPTPPHQVIPDVPEALSGIVMKLLSKTAEERYQSAWGLQGDLERCLQQFEATGWIELFALGESDFSDRFQIPQKLYGREREIATLLAAFDRVSAGSTEMMLVSGYSGIGKSSLVQVVYPAIARQHGYFTCGKFDQFQRNIPYRAIVKAFESLIQQLLTESEAKLQQWREKILAAVGTNGQILIDVIPEIELIIGEQPAVADLGPTEAQNRFNLVFQHFIRVFCQKEHPLVIFLDDLQWADSATLKLLDLMLSDRDTEYLFAIGAYRDNEVNSSHPLILTLEGLKQKGAILNEITLTSLGFQEISQLVADTLHRGIAVVRPLAKLVFEKTNGNPFFVNQFLLTLHSENLLIFIPPQSSTENQGGWHWDMAQIEAMGITDNVVELMLGKLKKLPKATQQVLQLAACVGNRFDLSILAIIYEESPVKTLGDLQEAIQLGLVQSTAALSTLNPSNRDGSSVVQTYRFLHDRVQQAAYTLIEEKDKQAVHLKIGRLLLKNTSPDALEESIFDIVNQLNIGARSLAGQSEGEKLARLNLIAGKKAKAATAYEPALTYLKVGLDSLSQNSWHVQYDLTLALYVEAAETACLCGDFEQMAQLTEVVLQKATSLLDRVRIYEVKLLADKAQNKQSEAVKTALTVLKLLGIRFPDSPSQFDIILGLLETKFNLWKKPIEDLINLPTMSDPKMLAAMRIMSNVINAVYLSAPQLFPLMVFKQVNLSIKYGNAAPSTFAYITYGTILCGVVGDITADYQFGLLALRLVDKLEAKDFQTKTIWGFNAFLRHWREPIRHTFQSLLDAYQNGLETGDLDYASWSALVYTYYSYFAGEELTGLAGNLKTYGEAIGQLKQEAPLQHNNIYYQIVLNLIGQTEEPWQLCGDAYNEEIELPRLYRDDDRTPLSHLILNKLILHYLFENYSQALDYAERGEPYLESVTGLINKPIFYFYDSLTRLAIATQASPSERKQLLRQVMANQKQMKKWAHHSPKNYRHKFYLVEAERHRVLGQEARAINDYDRASALAKEHRYLNEEALALELTAKFWLARKKPRYAIPHLREARYAYQRWGAARKVRALEEKYPQWLAQESPGTATRLPTTVSTSTSTSSGRSEVLDLTTVVKASQALTGEMMLDRLLAKLMHLVLENAGAQTGKLLLENDGQWTIEASGMVAGDEVQVLQSLPLESPGESTQIPGLPTGIINYVARTQDSVVLDDAANSGQFTRDRYIVATQPKSILCTPLLYQGKLSGILYLENNLTANAFTPERIELLQLLSSQFAISIENARLYTNLQRFNQNLEQLVSDRTRELSQTLDHLRTTQTKLVESEKMAALGGLVAGVAHEINTPIGIGVTAASLLAQKTTGFFETYKGGKMKRSDLEKFLDTAMQSSSMILANLSRAADLIQSFKQVAIDQSTEEKRIFKVKGYLEEILLSLRAKLKQTRHQVEIQGSEQLTLNSYPGVLSQIVTNLIINSLIHAYEPETAGRIAIAFHQDETQFQLEYSDDGKGIPPESLNRIFDPFFTTKRGQGGSGLGLHIIYNLVTQKLSGTIYCESQLGQGTKFIIKLPNQTLI